MRSTRELGSLFIGFLFFVACAPTFGAETEGDAQKFRYRWQPGKQYGYQFRIEAAKDDKIVITDGSISYSASPLKLKEEKGKATGTGFVVTADGCLVTCAHCVEGSTAIKVHLGGKTYDAKVIGWNENRDLALLRIEAKGLPVLPLGTDKSVELAESVRAIGFPLSDVLGNSVKITGGTIAGFVRRPHGRLFQVDASINPGNSGGPLVDSTGAVIGVNSAKLAGAKISNVAFSVPVDDVKRLLERYKLKHTPATETKVLAGPDLARRVVPSVALLEVTIGPGGYGFEPKHVVTYSGRMHTFVKDKKEETPKWSTTPPPGARPVSDRGSLLVDSTGKMHAAKAKVSLPLLLGWMGQLPIEPFGPAKGKRWDHEVPTTITVPKHGESDEYEELNAVERYDFAVLSNEGEMIVVQKKYELTTPDRRKGDSNIRLVANGSVKLDRASRIPQQAQFKATWSRTDGDETEEIPLRITYKRVKPTEIASVLGTPRPKLPVRPRPGRPSVPAPKAVDVTTALANLKLDDARAQREALALLAKASPDKPNREAAARMEELLGSADGHLRNAAASALTKWRTKESVPALIAGLEDESFVVRHHCIATLGTLADPRGAEAIVNVYFENKIKAHHALKAMGSAAEPAVQKMLFDPRWGVRADACKILAVIGTDASLKRIRELAASGEHGLVRMAAKKAAAEIEKR